MATRPLSESAGSGRFGKSVRPQTLLLALLGRQVLGREDAVALRSIISVLQRLGLGEPAIRATVSRMTRRGLLRTVRRGRQVYLGLTPHAVSVLREGERRIEAEVVDRDWDGRWTLLTFSVPETRRSDRHALRARLGWAGFGLLRSGLWVATSAEDVSPILAELELLDHAEAFRAEAALWTDPVKIAREAWDLGEIADGYVRFVDRWTRGSDDDPGFDELDELSRQTLMDAEWLLLIREDPHLPLALLPDNWPGVLAEEHFRALRHRLADPADKLAGELFDRITEAD